MKTRAFLLMSLALGWVGGRCAAGVEPVTVSVPALHVFGGARLVFSAVVDAPLGTRLSLRADLVQTTAGTVILPLQKDAPVSDELSFDARTHLTAPCSLPALPEVRRPTRLLLTLRSVGGDPPDTLSQTTAAVFVYPPENRTEWKKWLAASLARSGMTRLWVFGKGSTLRRWLQDSHADFEDGGAEWPAETHPGTLYLGDDPPPAPSRITSTDGWHLVLFLHPDADPLLPGVYQSADAHGGNVLKVTLPGMLDGLSEDPRSQQTLTEIFRRALDFHLPIATPTPEP